MTSKDELREKIKDEFRRAGLVNPDEDDTSAELLYKLTKIFTHYLAEAERSALQNIKDKYEIEYKRQVKRLGLNKEVPYTIFHKLIDNELNKPKGKENE